MYRIMVKHLVLESEINLDFNSSYTINCWVNLGKLLFFSRPQFCHVTWGNFIKL